MKPVFRYIYIALCLVLAAQSPVAAQSDRNTVRDLMRFYYVADINSRTYTPIALDNAAVMAGTETGPFWTNANMSGPQSLVRKLLRSTANGGDADMQRIAARILRIINKPVKVNLLDDSHANVSGVTEDRYGACSGTGGKAWPCASNMTTDNDFEADCARTLGRPVPARTDNIWAGNVCMGTVYFSGSGNMVFKLSTILHELLHTQDFSDGRGHMFWVGTTFYNYGADGSHMGTEAIPNMASTYKEGAANIIRLLYDQPRLNEMFNWFATNGNMLVEQAIHAPGTGPATDSLHPCTMVTAPSADVWLYNQLNTAGIHPTRTVTANGSTYGLFPIRSLPARFIAHNEYILALMGSQYAWNVGESQLFNAIQDVSRTLYRASGSSIAVFYNSLCTQAIPAGQTIASLRGSSASSGTPKPYLLPLAYADYFTGYTATTKEQFRDIFENQSYMNDWIDMYWDTARTRVRTAVPLTNPQLTNLTDIAIALGINHSVADH